MQGRARWAPILLALGVTGCGANAAHVSGKAPASFAPPAADANAHDVAITGCHASTTRLLAVTVRISNHGATRLSYLVHIGFATKDGSRTLGSTFVDVQALSPGEQTSQTATAFATPAPHAGYTCQLTDATAYPA